MNNNDPRNVGRAFLDMADKHPDLIAIISDARLVLFDELRGMVLSLVTSFKRRNVVEGSVVVVESEDIFIVLPTQLACALLGATWVNFNSHRKLSDIVSPTHWFVGSDRDAETTDERDLIEEGWFTCTRADPNGLPAVNLDAAWLFANTSGTTGTPKRLALSQAIMYQRVRATAPDFAEEKMVFASLFDCTAFPFIVRALACMVNGCTIVYSRSPQMWKMAGVTQVYGSVKQVVDILGDMVLPNRFPTIHVSGSKTSDALAFHLLQSFDEVVDLYASTETNRSYKNVMTLSSDGVLESRGEPLDSVVEIIGDHGAPIGPGEIGTVRVKNPYITANYIGNPRAQADALKDGWFYSGDFGSWGNNSELIIQGRKGDVINVGGVKVNALAIDEVLRSQVGIRDAMSFEDPFSGSISQIIAFVIYRPGMDVASVEAEALAACNAALGSLRTPTRLVETTRIPRAHDGGAQRFSCKDIYLALVDADPALRPNT